MRASAPLKWSCRIGIWAAALSLPVCAFLAEPVQSAPPAARSGKAKVDNTISAPVDATSADDVGNEPDRATIRLNYVDTAWDKVLKDFAEATHTELVADHVPTKQFSRWDWKRYTPTDALRILNEELQPLNFRLQFKGKFLVLNSLHDFRHEYPAAILRGTSRKDAGEVRTASAEMPADGQSRSGKTGKRDASQDNSGSRSRGGQIQQLSGEEEARPVPEHQPVRPQVGAAQPDPVVTAVRLKSRDSVKVAKLMYNAFKPEAEMTDTGPQGLQGFLVRRAQPGKDTALDLDEAPVRFAIGIDMNKNQLLVEATPAETKPVVKLIKSLDSVPKVPQGTARLMKTAKDAGKIAAALQPELDRLRGATRRAAARQPGAQDDEAEDDDQADQADDDQMPRRAPQRGSEVRGRRDEGDDRASQQALLGSLKGEVRVESVPELGILVVTGNQGDVESVMAVIQEIERLSKGTAPQVKLALLRHVSSEALASLLTTVYERLGTVRTGTAQPTQAISVFPVSRPNAVLVVASKNDIDAVFELIDELDQPSDPATEFLVYRLKHAIPSQVVDKVTTLYPPQQGAAGGAAQQQGNVGLIPRVRIIDDLRTNSVIVQARPRDLREVVKLIEELDVVDTASRQRIQIFRLENAVADEIAATLSSTIQNVLAPARATTAAGATQGGPGQAGGQLGNQAGGATGQGSAEIKEVKSSILEFLLEDGPDGRTVRSGILADIRMNPDLRTNSIVVTAPEESMELVAALIKRLDKPAAQAAEIKVFKLENSDATAMQTLLERLFGIQRTGQQGGAQGQQGQQGPPGLLLAGAEDSSSMLIPLRFSVDIRTNSIIGIGGAEALRVVEAVLLRLDESDIRQRQNEVYRLKNSPATSVATAISQFLQTQRQVEQADPGLVSPFEQIEREVIVVPETTSNSLLISATPRYFKEIYQLVVKLDRSPKQVLIQALIVEVQLNNVDEFGMELGLQDSILFNRSIVPAPTTITNTTTAVSGQQTTTQQIISESATPGYAFNGQPLGNNTSSGINQKSIAGQASSLFNTGLSNSTLGYGGLVLQAASENINFLLRALAARTRVDVLSRPQIRTVDNQLAQIQVGQEIPRINGFTPSGTAGVITPQFQQRPVGIILQVTPRISPDGLVVMEVVARKDSLSQQSVSLGTNVNGTAITSPIVNTTNAMTTIGVNSGQTVILGGMITKSDTVTERKVPVLGDVPVLGRLFRYDLKSMDRTELLIFLTPRIIRDDEEAEMFKQIEVERLNFIESEVERINGPIYGLPGPFDPSGSVPGHHPAGPAMPVPPAPMPPEPSIPGPSTSGRYREQQLLPGVGNELEGSSAMLRDDNEDLEAGFIQTNYRPPPKRESPGQKTGLFRKSPAPAKTGQASAKQSTKQKKQQGDDPRQGVRRNAPAETDEVKQW